MSARGLWFTDSRGRVIDFDTAFPGGVAVGDVYRVEVYETDATVWSVLWVPAGHPVDPARLVDARRASTHGLPVPVAAPRPGTTLPVTVGAPGSGVTEGQLQAVADSVAAVAQAAAAARVMADAADARADAAAEAAATADARAANARQMVLNRDARFDTVDERIAALQVLSDDGAAQQASLLAVAADMRLEVGKAEATHAELAAGIAGLLAGAVADRARADADRAAASSAVGGVRADLAVLLGQFADERARDLSAEAAARDDLARVARDLAAEVARSVAVDVEVRARMAAAEAGLVSGADARTAGGRIAWGRCSAGTASTWSRTTSRPRSGS